MKLLNIIFMAFVNCKLKFVENLVYLIIFLVPVHRRGIKYLRFNSTLLNFGVGLELGHLSTETLNFCDCIIQS